MSCSPTMPYYRAGIGQFHLRTQHEHAQALQRRLDQHLRNQQQVGIRHRHDTQHELGAALGIAPGRQEMPVGAESRDIVRQLRAKKLAGVGAGDADYAEA